MLIERRKCTNKSCHKTHRLLPDISLPYKHYDAGVIEDVIDGTIDEEALSEEYNPSESTLQRWRKWAERLMKDLEGHMRSAAYRILEMTEEFLNTRGVIARRTQGTTKLRMAECSHADIHKHRVRTSNSPHEDYPPTLQ